MTTDTPADPFARDVFLSYATQDAVAAQAVCAALEARGLTCWIAPRDVTPGAQYADAIVRAINGARLMVLVLSQYAAASPHVGREIERASSKQRRILALRLDAVPLTPALEYFLSESQWVDAPATGLEAAIPKVADAAQALLGMAAKPAAAVGSDRGALARSSGTDAGVNAGGRARRWPWVAGTALLVAALVAVGLFAGRRPAPPPSPAGVPAAAGEAAATAPAGNSVAVLPFEDLSEKKDQAYFSDGLSSELIDLLAKVPGLRVPARVSSFYFKGRQATLQDIAQALHVSNVLEGTVRSSGQKLRITTDLVNVATGSPVWSQTYDRSLDDIFKIQDEIAASVVGALKVSLFGVAIPQAVATANTTAYTAFLQCREYFRGNESREGAAAAVDECQRAVDLDPNFAPGWLLLAEVLRAQFVSFGETDFKVARARIGAAVDRALTLAPQSAAPHQTLALVLYQMDFDPAAAEMEVRKAVALDPDATGQYWNNGYLASIECRFDEALRAFALERDRNPLSVDVRIQLGNVNYRVGNLNAARQAYQEALAIGPASGSVHYRLGLVALLRGDSAGALAEFEQEPDRQFHAAGLPMAYDALGRKAEAERALAVAEDVAATGAAYQVALIHAARGDREKTFAWLNRAYAQRDAGMLWIKGEPFLKGFRADPRFKTLLHQMHLD